MHAKMQKCNVSKNNNNHAPPTNPPTTLSSTSLSPTPLTLNNAFKHLISLSTITISTTLNIIKFNIKIKNAEKNNIKHPGNNSVLTRKHSIPKLVKKSQLPFCIKTENF